jgi:hypothetical protein
MIPRAEFPVLYHTPESCQTDECHSIVYSLEYQQQKMLHNNRMKGGMCCAGGFRGTIRRTPFSIERIES